MKSAMVCRIAARLTLLFGLGLGAVAFAEIEALPSALIVSVDAIESAHEKGMNEFFKNLNEDCDSFETLNVRFQEAVLPPASGRIFKIESRIVASCLKQEIYVCQSTFRRMGDGSSAHYEYTDCETDSLLFED